MEDVLKKSKEMESTSPNFYTAVDVKNEWLKYGPKELLAALLKHETAEKLRLNYDKDPKPKDTLSLREALNDCPRTLKLVNTFFF